MLFYNAFLLFPSPAFGGGRNVHHFPVFADGAACHLVAFFGELVADRLIGQRFLRVFVVDDVFDDGFDGGGGLLFVAVAAAVQLVAEEVSQFKDAAFAA